MSKYKIYYGADVYATVDLARAPYLTDCPVWWQNFVNKNITDNVKGLPIAAINRRLRKYAAWAHEDKNKDIAAIYFRTEGGMVQFMLTYG